MVVSVSQTEQQWIPAKDRSTGRPVFVAVPSKSKPGAYHLVSSQGCDCKSWQYRQTCSHFHAIQAQAIARQRAELDAEYDRAWERWQTLAAKEDEILSHDDGDGPLPLSVSIALNELQRQLGLAERHLDTLQARRKAVA